MKVNPTRVGASVDVTNEVLGQAMVLVARLFSADEFATRTRLLSLADAADLVDTLVEYPSEDRPEDVIESAEVAVRGATDALVAAARERLDVSLVVELAETDCRRRGAELLAAANSAVTARPRRLSYVPDQAAERGAA